MTVLAQGRAHTSEDPGLPPGTGPGHPEFGEAWGGREDVREAYPGPEVSAERLREVHQRDFALQVLDSEAQHECGRTPVPKENPTFYRDAESDRVYCWGVKRCRSTTTCPNCARAHAQERARELQDGIRSWESEGGACYMLTATLPHDAGDTCEAVLEAVTEAWRKTKAGSPWQRWADRIGYQGAIRALDVTVGSKGWHWHVHAILALESELSEDDRAEFLGWFRERWADRVASFYYDEDGNLAYWPLNRRKPAGFEPAFGRPDDDRGVRLQRGEKAGWYVAKIGLARELTRVDAKAGRGRNRTPWQVLRDYALEGEERDRAWWAEYIQTVQGYPLVVWSPGLKEKMVDGAQTELELPEESDERPDDREAEKLVEVDSFLWTCLQAGGQCSSQWVGTLRKMLEAGAGLSTVRDFMQRNLEATRVPQSSYRPEVRMDRRNRYLWVVHNRDP